MTSSQILTNEQRKAIFVLVIGICLPLLDSTIVGVAIPALTRSMNSPLSILQWVSTGYTLAAACSVFLSAWASRRFGSRFMWISGLVVFLFGSLACALSHSALELIGFRIVQGVGAGILAPVMQSVLLGIVGQAKLKKAMATAAIPAVLAPILGPLVGGLLLNFADWPVIFWVNVPIAAAAILLSFLFLPGDHGDKDESFDLFGLLLLLPGFSLFLWGITTIARVQITDLNSIGFFIGIVLLSLSLLFLFLIWVLFGTKTPLVEIRLFLIPSFRTCIWLLFLSGFVFYGAIFFLPLFFMHVCGLTSFAAAMLVGVHGLGALFSRSFLDSASKKFGVGNTALAAIFIMTLGTLLLLPSELRTSPISLAGIMFLRGGGVGLLSILALSHVYQDIDRKKIPDASSLSRVATLVGAAIGTACIVVLKQLEADVGLHEFSVVIFGLSAAAGLCALPAFRLRRH